MSAKATKTKKYKYLVDVCYGGCIAMFPDGTLRCFRDKEECEQAIRTEHLQRRTRKDGITLSVIEWNYRRDKITERIISQ